MGSYFHSVTLDKEKCVGCTNCIKRCPTEAIRVHEGRAKIMDERCIDCGECIRVCPQHAKLAITDPLKIIKKYEYPVALPAPALFGQFPNSISVDQVLEGLLHMGFFRVWEVARAAELVTEATEQFILDNSRPRPLISSACPAVVRLITIRYPELIENILPIDSPMELAARLAKEELIKEGYPAEGLGVFFISPCAAKFTSVNNSLAREKSFVDGVLSIADIYGPLLKSIKSICNKKESSIEHRASGSGFKWAITGGKSSHFTKGNIIAADGLNNVASVLEDIDKGKLKEIDFFEGLACPGGCVGGPLTVENPFMAKSKIRALGSLDTPEEREEYNINYQELLWEKKILPKSVLKLDDDLVLAMKKLEELDAINKSLPGLDCGSCGAPTCRALAEDIVRGQADEIDCIFILKEKVNKMAEEMVQLSSKLPSSIGKKSVE